MKPKLYSKVRVVHSAGGDRFYIEVKEGWFGRWVFDTSYQYRMDDREYHTEYHVPKLTEDEAREKAIERAKVLRNFTIIWEE